MCDDTETDPRVNLDACRKLAPDLASESPAQTLLADHRVMAEFARLLNSFLAASSGTSIRDMVLMMPSLFQLRCSYQPRYSWFMARMPANHFGFFMP